MTQCEKILQYMERNGSITQAEAVERFHCYRLGARIFDLKSKGFPIKTETVTGKRGGRNGIQFRKILLAKGGLIPWQLNIFRAITVIWQG